jgi:hypothetical protein
MALGRVQLEDGRAVVGFLCEPAALASAMEITRFGDGVPTSLGTSGAVS